MTMKNIERSTALSNYETHATFRGRTRVDRFTSQAPGTAPGLPRPRTAALAITPRIFVGGGWLATGALFVLIATATSASAANSCVQGGQVTTNCRLDANFVGSVTIAASSVTLDCGSFKMSAANKTANVINIANVRNVTVKNCFVENGADGVSIINSRYVTLLQNSIQNNAGAGLKIDHSADVSLLNSVVQLNDDDGLELDSSYNIIIQNVTVTRNWDEGIDVDNCDNVYIYGSRVAYNGTNTSKGGDGIGLTNSSYVSVLSSDLHDNPGRGIDIKGGVYVKVQNNTFQNNAKGPYRDDGQSRFLSIAFNTYK
jgi:parallel beta-helix repeat protein